MIDLWRSDEMQLIQLIIPSDAAHDTMAALGEIGCLQFKDLNPDKSAFQRTYANQVKRCDEMVRKIRFFTDQVAKAEIVPSPRMGDFQYDLDELDVKLEELEDELLQMNNNGERLGRSYAELLELQLVLERARTFFDYGGGMVDMQTEGFNVHSGAGTSGSDNMDAPLLETTTGMDTKMSRLGYVAGMIELEKVVSFERLLFRSTRGNMYLRQTSVGQVKDPTSGEMKEKAVFVVFFAGERARAKILKICEAYGANRYPVPEDVNRQRQMNGEVTARLKELKETIDAGDSHRQGLLQSIAANLESWTVTVRREKAVYHQLNKLSIDVTRKCLVAEAWAPVDRRQDIQAALQSATERSNAMVGTVFQPLASHEAPPTHYNTNKVQSAFQAIVDAYGVARYREVNPATFTIITFPFLFAVMFGDLGHAFLMLLFAIWLIWNEKAFLKQKLNDMLDMAFAGRYVVLLMAIFSIFTGIIYNEFFSVPMTLFGDTKYRCAEADLVTIRGQPELGIPARIPALEDNGDDFRDCYVFTNSSTCTYGNLTRSCIVASEDDGGRLEFFTLVQKEQSEGYPFGVDPVWHGTDTELEFLNSMKMKLSIILGVSQMNLGIIMSLFNQMYFRDTLSIWCEFIPQMLFLNGLFGYMSFIMVYKWASYIPTMEDKSLRTSYNAFAPGLCPEFGAPPTDSCPYTARPPDIFHIMIYMFLEPFNVDCSYMPGEYNPTNGTKAPCPENVYWGDISSGGTPTQAYFQVLLVVVALLCVPWMLLIKPFILKKRHQERTQGQQYNSLRDADPETDELAGEAVAEPAAGGGGGGHGHGDEFEFGEVMVHQMIHTIEFVLGAVSNTASYLRLWALSLAHSQLSAVFYDQLLMRATALDGATMQTVGLFIAYFVWALATMGVLMVMESLSAFLHALRLHWVEFQNKFFHGDGYAFAPFSFEEVDKEAL